MNGVRILAVAVVTSVIVQSSPAQTSSPECKSETISIAFLAKPGDGWDVSFVKEAAVVKTAPMVLGDGKDNQELHHRKISFEEEFVTLLRKHGITFDPQFVFD
jgi:hypothetical protein